MFANMAAQSVEILESEQPVEILACEFIPDAMGAGRFRGGAPYRRDYRFLEQEAVLQVRSDRRDVRPYGLYGGYPGSPSRNVLNPGEEAQPLPSKLTMTIRAGDVFRHELAGSGGWGDPLERDPERVLRDVRNGLLSIAAARASYGVIIDAAGRAIDRDATEVERDRISAARGWTAPPAVLRTVPDGLGEAG
jgi:N-methylhydantoinase B